MTQRIFDIENKKDMADLWDILPDNAVCINFINKDIIHIEFKDDETLTSLFKINWHDKTEITRPIQEATEADIGKLCKFVLKEPTRNANGGFGILTKIEIDERGQTLYLKDKEMWFNSCRRLTKQEIEELC